MTGLAIPELRPTQDGLRSVERLGFLTADVRRGRRFADAPIAVSEFEDGARYVHNGHHRVVACVLAGRLTLDPDEVQVTRWVYAEYRVVNFAVGYVTPFDPRTESRIADLGPFRAAVAKLRDLAGDDPAKAFIAGNRDRYTVRRRVRTFAELAALSVAEMRVAAAVAP